MSESIRLDPPTTLSIWGLGARILADVAPFVRPPVAALVEVLRNPQVLRGLAVAVMLLAFAAAIRGAENSLLSQEAYHVDPSCMKIREMPPWLDPNWADTIRNPFMGRRSVNLFEPDLTTQVYDAYRESPWIEDIPCVRKEFPNRLKIRIRIRTPLAAVPFGKQFLLVDGHGVLLPRPFTDVPDFGFPLRTVEGADEAPPEPGRCWESGKLRAGLQVAAILTASEKKIFDRIVRVDVSLVRTEDSHAGRTEILLFAAEGGGPIEWGAAPGRRNDLEIPLEKKLENLEFLLTECTDMRKVKYAHIQFDQPVYKPR